MAAGNKIMDANLLACPDHENLIEQLIRSRAWVDFSQGLDIRLVNRDNVSLLNRVRIKAVHFAWDNPDEDLTGYFQRFLDLTAIKSSRQRRVYVLTKLRQHSRTGFIPREHLAGYGL